VASRVRVPIPRLLEQLGIRAKREGRLWKSVCPDPAHDDRDPSWSIIDDGGVRHGSHWCMSCGFGGGPWELVAAVRGLTIEEAGAWCWEHVVRGHSRALEDDDLPRLRVVMPRRDRVELELPRGVMIPSVDGSEWHPRALSYLTKPIVDHGRGIPDWQITRWHIGFATIGRCAWRVVVPVYTGGRLLSYVARAFLDDGRVRYLTPDAKSERGCRPDAALFGEPGFDRDVRVATVTEGVFKALAMERAGAPNPCAILGANNLGAEKIEALARFDAVLVATDPDKAGDTAFERLYELLARYTTLRRVHFDIAPDDASDEANGAAWREAITHVHGALRRAR
jgi:hypothetical protein